MTARDRATTTETARAMTAGTATVARTVITIRTAVTASGTGRRGPRAAAATSPPSQVVADIPRPAPVDAAPAAEAHGGEP